MGEVSLPGLRRQANGRVRLRPNRIELAATIKRWGRVGGLGEAPFEAVGIEGRCGRLPTIKDRGRDDDDENDWKSGIFGLGQLCRMGSVRTESS
jgi:hypothetical protein